MNLRGGDGGWMDERFELSLANVVKGSKLIVPQGDLVLHFSLFPNDAGQAFDHALELNEVFVGEVTLNDAILDFTASVRVFLKVLRLKDLSLKLNSFFLYKKKKNLSNRALGNMAQQRRFIQGS
eukprot:TRINITY_DN3954_c0_g1_i3.p1 TRINITY_DN3954_c0_g1~~TRINITY_DN3954_c0_g1_i3.p1  ORF type:complete len:124 (-),score=15.07 TRINITY_DN3954_c0_g1_i3:98-469(-)